MQIHKFYLLLLFLPLLLPAVSMAQTPDTLYVFRFVSHKDMFYIPWKGNGTQLDHLLSLVENHKAAILSGEAPLLVDGYCASEPTVTENLKLAKIRSNRVKSELILCKGINENCFITRNHAETYGDLRHVVIVRLRLPKDEAAANVKEDSVIPVIKEKEMEAISENSEQGTCPDVKGNTNLYHALLEPESYELLVYNVPESITVSGDIATVTAAGGNGIEALPGYLFSAVQALDMAKDDTLSVTVKMRQRIRQLTLVLKLKEGDHEHITAVNATLSGIASGINLRTGALVSTSDTFLSPVFMKTEASDGTPTLTATIRLFGILPEDEQELTVAVTLDNGTVQTIETDLTEVLHEHLDDGSMTPLILGANFDLPSQADFSGEISNWSPVDGGQVDIH